MKITGVCLLTFVWLHIHGQGASEFAQRIDTADLKKYLYHIASAEMQGRETATEGQKKAAAYLERYFRSLGLRGGINGSFQQRFPVYRDSLSELSIKLENEHLRKDTDYAVTYNSPANISISAQEILFIGFGRSDSIRDDYSGVQAQGKIVMSVPGSPRQTTKGKRRRENVFDFHLLQQAARKNGAAALLIVDERFPRSAQPVLGEMYVNEPEDLSAIPTFFISDSVARIVMGASYDSVRRYGGNAPRAQSYSASLSIECHKVVQRLSSTNVVAVLEGTSLKNEAVVITAHYDHLGKRDSVIYYGADDDGSGTVTLMELAEAFTVAAANGVPPKRTIVFMAVSGEEKGLWGSDFYASNAVIPLDSTSANINIDMIGRIEDGRKRDSSNYIYVVGDNRLSSDLRPISEAANKQHTGLILDYKFNDPNDPQRIYYRSDHYNFAKFGVPAIFYFSGLHSDYHRPGDTPDKINYPLLQKRARLIFYTAWEIANRDKMLKRDLN